MAETGRFELRIDETTDRMIAEAAELMHTTRSAFVADAARQAAETVIARADVTLMPSDVFAAMMATLNRPDESAELATLAALPRRISR